MCLNPQHHHMHVTLGAQVTYWNVQLECRTRGICVGSCRWVGVGVNKFFEGCLNWFQLYNYSSQVLGDRVGVRGMQ